MRTLLALIVFLALFPGEGMAADIWHLKDCNARAVVEVATESKDPGCDVCAVKILCQGRARADGADYRVVDASGKSLPFELTFHDAPRYSLVAFRAQAVRGKYYVYFDNPQSARASVQIVAPATPGTGPPSGVGPDKWLPKYGFVLQTMQRPKGDNPRTMAEMVKLMANSKHKHGARYQRCISDGYNRFGPSDYYISAYRGWVRVPKSGKYQFCTISNEASFSFLGGKELIHWPGRHTADRGLRGEVNALVELKQGLQYLEYYHEEVTLEQMAFLGWRPSADDGPFSAIPESFYTAAHEGVVKSYETPKGKLSTFEPIITDSLWPAERSEGQYTRVRFEASGLPGITYRWNFGDGVEASGSRVDHLYLNPGTYKVTLKTMQGATTATATWPLDVFEIEHITDQFKEGRPKEYLDLVKNYDRDKLSELALRELAFLHLEGEDIAGALAVGRTYVKRFEKAPVSPLHLARVRRVLADCALQLDERGLDEAIKNYQASLIKEFPITERLEVTARLVRLVGVRRKEAERALGIFRDAESSLKRAELDEDAKKAFRKAVQAAGDVLLWHGKRTDAQKFYARAESLLPRVYSTQVRAARIGAYPNSLREYLASGNYGAALDLVEQWEDLFSTDKLNGQTFFWRGKILALRGQHQDAALSLDLAVRLSVGARYETEARWLLAESLYRLGKKEEARQQLAKLVSSGLTDEFVKKAVEKLKK